MHFRYRKLQALLMGIMLIAIFVGIFSMGGAEIYKTFNQTESSIRPLDEDWTCQVDESDTIFKVNLPSILPLEEEATSITLTNTLPLAIQKGDAMRLQTLSGWYEIYINGILRVQYGNRTITNAYWYENASSLLFVPLTADDAGKSIIIRTGSINAHHLAIQREPFIGAHRDFLMSDMMESTYGNMLIIVLSVTVLLLLAVWLFFLLKKQGIKQIPSSVGFLVMMILYYNVGNLFFLEVFSYAPSYFGLNDFVYYVLNIFLPIAGYLIICPTVETKLKKFHYFLIIHLILALFTFIIQIKGHLNYESLEIVMTWITLVGYIWLFIEGKPWEIKKSLKWFVYPVFICILACLLDYAKYMVNLDWLPQNIANYLQVESPFMLFLPIAMVIFVVMTLIGVMQMITDKQVALVLKAEDASSRAAYAEREHRATMESFHQIRKLRHDMEYHFMLINSYLKEGKNQDASDYIQTISSLLPNRTLSNKNFVTGCFVEQYRLLCSQSNIQFIEEIGYDEDSIKNKTMLGIILGNGLKNAYESAFTTKNELRFIKIMTKQVHDNIIILIQNGYNHKIDPNLKSTKSKGRGLGIANMKDAAESCGGYLDCSYENSVFTLKIVLVSKN